MNEFLTSQDIAERLHVNIETVRRWLRTGKLKGTPLGRAGYRIEEADYEAFLRARKDADRTINRLASLLKLATHLSAALTPSQVADVIIRQGLLNLHANVGIFSMLDKERTEFKNLRIVGYPQALIDAWPTFPADAPVPVADAVRERQLLIFESLADRHARYPHLAYLRALGSEGAFVALPLLVRDRPIGGLAFGFPDERTFSEDEHAFLLTLAELAAQALERARLYSVSAAPLHEEQGTITGAMAVFQDITARKQAEQQLQEREEQLQFQARIAQSLSDAIIFTDMDYTIFSWNEGAEQLYGWKREEVIGKKATEFLYGDFLTSSREDFRKQLTSAGFWRGEVVQKRRDGTSVYIQATVSAVKDASGNLIGAVAVNRDITELRQLEKRKDEFISMASHELRTPLTSIKLNLQLAQRRLQSSLKNRLAETDGGRLRSQLEDIQILLERAERQVNVQDRLVGDLLAVSHIQVGKLELHLQPCNLVTIVQEALRDEHSKISSRVILEEPLSTEPVPVIADADRIEQVVSNYVSNALKYSPAVSPVKVRLQVQGQQALVSVSDEGPGLSPHEQEHIWERFYRVEGIEIQSGSGSGLGLGLYICRTIIEQHHGHVGVESLPGKGSTFWFTLPLANPPRG